MKECEKRRSASGGERRGVRVEKERVEMSTSKGGVRVEKECE